MFNTYKKPPMLPKPRVVNDTPRALRLLMIFNACGTPEQRGDDDGAHAEEHEWFANGFECVQAHVVR